MAMKSSHNGQILGPLVLAFLMVFTVLATVTPKVEAIATSSPLGLVQVTTEPDFELPDYNAMGPTGSAYYPWNAPVPIAPDPNPLKNYPAHPAVVYANTKGSDPNSGCPGCFQRTVRVAADQIGTTQIDFVYFLRDSDPEHLSKPACMDGPFDPCLPKAIKWRPDYSYVTRPGWTVTANAENSVDTKKFAHGDDTPAARILSFTKTGPIDPITGAPIPQLTPSSIGGSASFGNLPNSLDIVIAFTVEGAPTGDSGGFADEFHVQVNVYPSGNQNIPFETTCPAYKDIDDGAGPLPGTPNPQSTFTCVFTNPPFTGPAGAGFPGIQKPDPINGGSPPNGCNIAGGFHCGTPSLVIRMDDTPPAVTETLNGDARTNPVTPCICSFMSQDTDHNGHIDRFIVSFTEPINPHTFDMREFTIQTKGRDRAYVVTNSFFEQQDPTGGGLCIAATYFSPGSSCRVDLLVAEMPFYDTGDTPNLSYPCTGCVGTITDRAGNLLTKMSGTAIVAVDRAPPVLMSAYALDLAHNGGVSLAQTQMHVFFSEDVVGSGCTDPQVGPPPTCGTRPVVTSDLCYLDDTIGGTGDVIGKPTPDLPSGGRQITAIGTNTNPSDTLTLTAGGAVTPGMTYYIVTPTGTVSGTTAAPSTGTPGPPPIKLYDKTKNFAALGVTAGMFVDFSGGCSAPVGSCQNCFSLDTPYDTSSGVCQPAPKCRYFDFVDHVATEEASPVGTAGTGWKMVVLTQVNPTDTINRLRYGASDVQPFNGDMVSVNVAPKGLSRGCLTIPLFENGPCNSDVRDMHDNGAWYPTGAPKPAFPRPPALAHVTFPMVKSATVDTSNPDCPAATDPKVQDKALPQDQLFLVHQQLPACHYWLKVLFNGPVRGPKGPSSCDTTTANTKSAKPFFACNLDIFAAAGAGQGPQGFLGPAPPATSGSSTVNQAPYFLTADSDTAILQMDFAARPVDVSLSGARVKIQCNTIFATPGLSVLDPNGPADTGYSLDPTTTGARSQAVGVIPCDDPDQYYGPGEDANGVVQHADVDVVDRTPPHVVAARTVDADHSGYLDGIELTFSEPVDDATYCGGGDSALSAPNYCPDSWSSGAAQTITFSRWDSQENVRAMVNPREEECRGPFRWDSGLVTNDNVGIVSHVGVTTTPDNTYITRVADCVEYYPTNADPKPTDPVVKWPTDSLLHITTVGPGLFADMASHPFHDNSDIVSAPNGPPVANPNVLPQICQFQSKAMTGPTNPPGFNQLGVHHPEPVCDSSKVSFDSVKITDGAPPVLWKAETYDTPVVNANGIPDTKNTYNNIYGDGTIDGYRLTFSEPVNDGSFNRNDWHIDGFQKVAFTNQAGCSATTPVSYTNHDVRLDDVLPGKPPMRTRDTTLVAGVDNDLISKSQSDAQFILLFTPAKMAAMLPGQGKCQELKAVYDTQAKPELTGGAAAGSPMHLTDRVGNAMLGFDTNAVQEVDDAGPQIVRVEGFAGTQHIDVRFSEPVDNGAHGGLVRDAFQYFDKDGKGVAGLSSTLPVQHQAGDRNATLLLGETITASDQATDKIGARFCHIYETAPSVLASERKCVPSYPHSLVAENDTASPGGLSDFKVVQPLTNANSLTVSWTAPGDDGTTGAAVGGYTCLVSDTVPRTGALIGNETNPTGVGPFTPDPVSLASPGHTQTMRIPGLHSETKYWVACYAIDKVGNVGPISPTATATTTRDVTPPGGTITIQSSTHPSGVPKSSSSAAFTWNDIQSTELESLVVYHYALNQNPNYVVLATDGATTDTKIFQLVPSNGDWYFHVAGMSGGGSTLTAHYHLVVGKALFTAADMESANDILNKNVTAYRQEVERDGQTEVVNNVTWELPPIGTAPGLDIIGLEIWRDDNGVFTKLNNPPGCVLKGDYNSLQKGYCVDVTPGANADSKYRVDMIFAGTDALHPQQTQADPLKESGYSSLVDQTPTVVPPWVWILAGVALALILSGLVIFFILRRRQKEDATGGVAYSWESANPELLGVDEATGLPVHEVRCPSCNNPFQAVGALPLPVTCPTCGTTGQLD